MSKKKSLGILILGTLLGVIGVWFSNPFISDLVTYPPSHITPLTAEEFAEAQEKGIASFFGSIQDQGAKPNYLKNSAFLLCRKEISTCDLAYATASLYTTGTAVLENTITSYTITQWNDDGIITAEMEAPECAGTYYINADVKARTVSLHNNVTNESCLHGNPSVANSFSNTTASSLTKAKESVYRLFFSF